MDTINLCPKFNHGIVRYPRVDGGGRTLTDRLTHHCHIVETGNESYRFQHSSMAAKGRIKAREQKRKADKAAPNAAGEDESE